MQGKEPKERDKYVIRIMNGSLVEVSREVYLEWYQSKRRERYQEECDQKYGVCSLSKLEEKKGNCGLFTSVGESAEEIILTKICQEKVREILLNLPVEDFRLIEMLYFGDVTVTDIARIFGCNRKTIQNRRKRILNKLCWTMQKEGIQNSHFCRSM